MSFVLSTRPKLLYLTNKQFQTISKRLLSQSAKSSYSTTKALFNSSSSAIKTTTTTPKKQYKKSVALVSGVIIVGSYILFNQSNYYNLDTLPLSLPPPPPPPPITQQAKKFLQDSTQKKYFSTSVSMLNGLDQQLKDAVYLLNEDQVNTKLRQYEESYFVNRGKGVTRYDVCQLPSNSPIEDYRAEDIVQVPILQENNVKGSTDLMFFGLYDGHLGRMTSYKLKNHLIKHIIKNFESIYNPVIGDGNLRYVPDSATIDKKIIQSFLNFDNQLLMELSKMESTNRASWADLLLPAMSGSCALMSIYDSNSQMLKVAVTGDSRAILGSFKDNQWTVRQLSIDQTGSNPSEVARIISEHPDEPHVIRNGRVLGSLEPTRAFGDYRYKLPALIQERIYKQFFGRPVPKQLKSPPYVTAAPVITTTKINPNNHDFLVMASDGLYELLTNEEIVGLVVKWMEKEGMIKPKKSWFGFGSADGKLPAVQDITNDKSSKKPFQNKLVNGFSLEDSNVGTHLIRNSLSNGGSKEHTSMLLSIPSPISRRYRDDLTVTVVFFGKDPAGENDNGTLEINWNATAGGPDASKPKL